MQISSFIQILNSIHQLSADQYSALQLKLKQEFGQPNVVLFNLQKELADHLNALIANRRRSFIFGKPIRQQDIAVKPAKKPLFAPVVANFFDYINQSNGCLIYNQCATAKPCNVVPRNVLLT